MNPMKLLQIKSALDRFQNNHPKFPKYLSAVYQKGLREGTLMEFKVTTPEGEELAANIKLNEEDLALFRELKELFQNP